MTDRLGGMTKKKTTPKKNSKSQHTVARKKGDNGYPTELARMLNGRGGF
jgi:hypothetical protein